MDQWDARAPGCVTRETGARRWGRCRSLVWAPQTFGTVPCAGQERGEGAVTVPLRARGPAEPSGPGGRVSDGGLFRDAGSVQEAGGRWQRLMRVGQL